MSVDSVNFPGSEAMKTQSVSWKTFRVSSCKIMLINFWFWMNRKQSVCIPHANGGAKNGWGKSLVKQEYFYVYIFSTARCLFTMRRKNIFSQSKTEQMKWIQGGLWGCNMIIIFRTEVESTSKNLLINLVFEHLWKRAMRLPKG